MSVCGQDKILMSFLLISRFYRPVMTQKGAFPPQKFRYSTAMYVNKLDIDRRLSDSNVSMCVHTLSVAMRAFFIHIEGDNDS